MADEMVFPEDISKEMLHSLYTDAYVDVSYDEDGDLLLRERYAFWAFPEADGKRIRLASLFRANENSNVADRFKFVNRINDELIMVRAYVRSNGNFGFDYYIPVEGGISKRNIVMATKLFASLLSAVARKDEEDVMA